MYDQLMQNNSEASVLLALSNGSWIHPHLSMCYIEEGDTLLITTLDNHWLRFQATRPSETVELRWQTTLPSTVEERHLYQLNAVQNNLYVQLHRILHVKAYVSGTDTELTDVTWIYTADSTTYQTSLQNRIFLEGQVWRVD